jgi:hypothetical protein
LQDVRAHRQLCQPEAGDSLSRQVQHVLDRLCILRVPPGLDIAYFQEKLLGADHVRGDSKRPSAWRPDSSLVANLPGDALGRFQIDRHAAIPIRVGHVQVEGIGKIIQSWPLEGGEVVLIQA